MMLPLMILFGSLFAAYVGTRCLVNYYRFDIHPPGDEAAYKNSAWFFVVLGIVGVVGSLFGLF